VAALALDLQDERMRELVQADSQMIQDHLTQYAIGAE